MRFIQHHIVVFGFFKINLWVFTHKSGDWRRVVGSDHSTSSEHSNPSCQPHRTRQSNRRARRTSLRTAQSIMDELLMSELSADTLAALQAHLLASQPVEEADSEVSEDFRLSQLYVLRWTRVH
jgi:hypothetical protein